MNESVKYKFECRDYSSLHDTWEEAADEAVKFGVGRWLNKHEFNLDWPAVIKAVRDE